MALPKQVQAQVDALAEYEKKVAETTEPTPTEDSPAEPAPDPTPQPQEPAPAEPPKPAEDSADVWKQRYRSLQGQYNSQVPALQAQVQQLTDSVNQLTAKLQQASSSSEPQDAGALVTNKDVEAFGEDLVDLARRIAKEEFGKRETGYVKQIKELQGQLEAAQGDVNTVAQTQARSASERFFDGLTRVIPTWEQVQATQECQEWLMTRVPGTRSTWDQALKQAAADRDVDAVVEVFDVFFEKYPKFSPKAKPVQQNRQELNRQVAPGKSTASSPPQGKRTYTAAEYVAESNRQLNLMKQGRMDEAKRIEAELDAATAEGRITP